MHVPATLPLGGPLSGTLPVPGLSAEAYIAAQVFGQRVSGSSSSSSGGSGITALTGDVTATGPGSAAATIPADTVTYAKMQNVSAASRLLGRGSAGGSGDVEELSLGGGLVMSGTTLGATDALVYSNTTVPAGNTIANTVTETAFSSSYTIPANTLAAGSVVRLKLYGVYSTDAALAPTIRGKVKFGSTTMLDTGAITVVIGVTNGGWWAEGVFICQTAGGSGTVEAQGYVEFATAATTGLSVNTENTAAIAIDTTTTQAITLTIEWGTADTDNTITLREMTVNVEQVTGVAAPAAGALVLLEQHTASTSASLNFTSCISSTYDEYQIELINIIPVTDAVNFWMRMSTDGGSTYDTSSIYSYERFSWVAAGSGANGATAQTKLVLPSAETIKNTSTWGLVGSLKLFSPGSASLFKQVRGEISFLTGTTRDNSQVRGTYESTTAVNAFQFLFSSGNMASGTIRVYGIAK